MNSIQTKARLAGILYLFVLILAPLNLVVSGRFIVSGDAAATARNITASELTYRLSVLSGVVVAVIFLFVVLSLYDLLKDVDRRYAGVMVVLVSLGTAIGLVNTANRSAPLILLSGADFLSVFSKPQLEALSFAFLRLGGTAAYVATAFWGMWLFPFGVLVIKSRFFPKILGYLLIVGCFAYLALSITSLVFPAQRSLVNQIMMPFYAVGELAMIFWLLFKGADAPRPEAQLAHAA